MVKNIVIMSLCLSLLMVPLPGQAAELRSIQPGDTYYLDELFENKLVIVLGKENGRVKVRAMAGGAVDWVAPSRLLTQTESTTNDTVEQLAGIGIAAGILVCLFNPAVCTDSSPNPRGTTSHPPARLAPQSIEVSVRNDACSTIDYYVNGQRMASAVPSGATQSFAITPGDKTTKVCTTGTTDCADPKSQSWTNPMQITVSSTSPCRKAARSSQWLTNTLIPGPWQEASAQERASLTKRLSAMAPTEYRSMIQGISRLRATTLPFYRDALLIEGEVTPAPGQTGVLSFVLHRNEITVLDGTGPVIHQLNTRIPLELKTQEQAERYLEFSTSSLWGGRNIQSPAYSQRSCLGRGHGYPASE